MDRDLRWDQKLIVIRSSGTDSVWDGSILNKVYNPTSMQWEAMTQPGGSGGGGAGDASAANQATQITAANLTNTKLDTTNSTLSNIYLESKSMITAIDEVSTSLTYFGYATAGSATSSGVWKIKRMVVSGTVSIITWANGNTNFSNIWDNRASLTYS